MVAFKLACSLEPGALRDDMCGFGPRRPMRACPPFPEFDVSKSFGHSGAAGLYIGISNLDAHRDVTLAQLL
jgi:hypothetical protein